MRAGTHSAGLTSSTPSSTSEVEDVAVPVHHDSGTQPSRYRVTHVGGAPPRSAVDKISVHEAE